MALSTTLVIVSPVFSALSRIFASISWLNRNVTGLLSRLLLCMRCMYSACADVRNNYFGNVFTQLYNGRVSTDVKKLKKPITLRFGPELLARLDEFAAASGMTRTEMIERCVSESMQSVALTESDRRADLLKRATQAQRKPSKG